MKFTFVFLVFSILALPVFAKDLPDSIKGKWEVAEVHINTEASRAPFYAIGLYTISSVTAGA
jgi:hypothetical protein